MEADLSMLELTSRTMSVTMKESMTGICKTKKGSSSHSLSSTDLNPASLAVGTSGEIGVSVAE